MELDFETWQCIVKAPFNSILKFDIFDEIIILDLKIPFADYKVSIYEQFKKVKISLGL